MSVYPKIYSKCLSSDENRSFSHLVPNENAIIVCGVTTKGKIITLERLGAAYCIKLYCLTTNSIKWERIIQKDMRVLQYANINIFVINDEKHAFELVDRDESLKLYEKIRGCIKKLSASPTANPTSESATASPQPKQKPVRPPPTYKTSIKTPLQSNVLTVPSAITHDLIDISDTSSNSTNDYPNATSTNCAKPIRPAPRIRYPEEISRNALPNAIQAGNPNISKSPLRSDQRELPQSPAVERRMLSVHLNPTIANTRIPIPSPRRSRRGIANSANARSPILGEGTPLTQDIGIPIASSYNGMPNQILLSRQNSTDNGNASSTANGPLNLDSPVVNRRRVPNVTSSGFEPGSTTNIIAAVIINGRDANQNNQRNVINGDDGATINSVSTYDTISTPTTSYNNNLSTHQLSNGNITDSAGTSNVLASVINGTTSFFSSSTSVSTNVTASSFPTSISTPNITVSTEVHTEISTTGTPTSTNVLNSQASSINSPNLQRFNQINLNSSSQTSTTTSSDSTTVTSSFPMPINSPNRPIQLTNNSTETHSSVQGILVHESNYLPAPADVEPVPIQGPKRRVKTANSANRFKTRSAFIQPPSMVTDVIGQFRSRLFGKGEDKTPQKCMVIGKPTDVTHQVHLDSLDFRNMKLQDNQLKGLKKSKSMEHISSLDTNLTVFEMDEDGPCCVICLTNPPTHVIVPCGHKILCEACVQENVLSKLRRKWCMTCNGVIREIIKVYE